MNKTTLPVISNITGHHFVKDLITTVIEIDKQTKTAPIKVNNVFNLIEISGLDQLENVKITPYCSIDTIYIKTISGIEKIYVAYMPYSSMFFKTSDFMTLILDFNPGLIYVNNNIIYNIYVSLTGFVDIETGASRIDGKIIKVDKYIKLDAVPVEDEHILDLKDFELLGFDLNYEIIQ